MHNIFEVTNIMKFNNINELSKTYEVKASFYKKNDTTFRNYADIIRKGEIVNIS